MTLMTSVYLFSFPISDQLQNGPNVCYNEKLPIFDYDNRLLRNWSKKLMMIELKLQSIFIETWLPTDIKLNEFFVME